MQVMAAVVLSTAADHALNKAAWPTVGSGAAWCVIEGLKWAVKEFHAAGEYPQELQELEDMLDADSLQQTASLLDSVTDHPGFSAWRDDYTRLCDALEDAVLEFEQWRLMRRERCLAAEPRGGLKMQMKQAFVAGQQLFRRAMHRDTPRHLRKTLQHFVCFENFAQLQAAENEIQQSQAQGVPRVINQSQYTPPTCSEACGPVTTGNSSPPVPPEHVFQHCDDLVPHVDKLLSTTRHIGIVGMAGIGKTTIARAVFERAKARFPDNAVWLTVGKEAPQSGPDWALTLLRTAFAQLFPHDAPPFKNAQDGLNDLAHRLHRERNQPVLLVLDDVWLDEKHAVVASLNFATDPQSRRAGSRLIITTRERGTLSDNPNAKPARAMDELEVVKPTPLRDEHAQQLFEHHAFDPGSQRPELNPQEESLLQGMLKECGGNPLALQVLGEAVKRRPANGWERSLKEFRELRIKLKDAASAACAVSVEALPPSLQECFIDFAAFQEDARVEEGELVHLFATHAPLHSPHSVQAAKFKLDELVQRSLVSVEWRRISRVHVQGTPLYYMHDVLHSIARSRARQAKARRTYDDSRKAEIGDVRYISMQGPSWPRQGLAGCTAADQLRACIIDNGDVDVDSTVASPLAENSQAGWPSMLRLRYLSVTDVDVTGLLQERSAWHRPRLKYLRLIDCTGASSVLDALFSMGQLEDVSLSHVTRLPNSIGQCSQLTRLMMKKCAVITELPGSICDCTQLACLAIQDCINLVLLPDRIGSCSMLRHISLSGCKSLDGLPDSIRECTQLARLDISGCGALTHLPERIGDCDQLVHLDLGGCRALTHLPERIGDCDQLVHLNLLGCGALTHLPERIGDCAQLAHLDLLGCGALTHLPETIGDCAQLAHLNLCMCKTLTHVPKRIGDCAQLAHLLLIGCGALTHLPERIGDCAQLAHLHLVGCGALTHLPETICDCTPLTRLNLRACQSLTHLPERIGDCAQLAHLDLIGCGAVTHLPETIGDCAQLAHLDLSGCKRLMHLPQRIVKCAQLKHLDLSGCGMLTHLPERIGGCAQLVNLNLRECEQLTHLPETISGCAQLTHFHLSGCQNLTHVPAEIGDCAQLARLDLNLCKRLAHLPQRIGDCAQLTHLDLSGCKRLTHLPDRIGDCAQLKHLDLSGCGMLTHLPERIGGCAQLVNLNLRECEQLTHLPETISGCAQLTHFHLSGCQNLTHVPAEIGDCAQLARLDLNLCKRLAHLPQRIGDCAQLTHLDLSKCERLTHLPDRIGDCTWLTHLDLSWCTSLALLPTELSCCAQLAHLDIRWCESLSHLPAEIGGCGQLTHLNFEGSGLAQDQGAQS